MHHPSPRDYNFIAPLYDHIFRKPLSEGHVKIGNLLRKTSVRKERCKVLEVGVGSGLTFDYLPSGMNYVGIDISKKMLSVASSKLPLKNKTIELKVMNAERLKFADNTFDLVLAPSVLSAMNKPLKGLEEIIRVTKPGGRIAVIVNLRKKDSLKSDFVKAFDPLTRKFLGFRLDLYMDDLRQFKNVKMIEQKEVNNLFGQSLSTYVLLEKIK